MQKNSKRGRVEFMKCWQSNKKNPSNKHKSANAEDIVEYGSFADSVAMISAISSICSRKRAKEKRKREGNDK